MPNNEAHGSVELDAKRLKRLKAVTRVLDDAVEVPLLGFRVGLDPLLGLFPGVGDVVGATLSGWMVVTAARMGATPATSGSWRNRFWIRTAPESGARPWCWVV